MPQIARAIEMRDNPLRSNMNRGTLLFIVAAMLSLAVGCKTSHGSGAFEKVEMKSLEDSTITVGDYRGKVVLVNFWATWCEPCKVEIPWLIEMQTKYAGKGFTVLGIAMDDEGKPIVVGNEKVAEKFGGLLGYPTSVLISRDGRVLKRTTGLIDYDATTKMIEGAL